MHDVTDPEQFFGAKAGVHDDALPPLEDMWTKPARWRLLVLEDTADLLASPSADRAVLASRGCLNVVDGIVGQGLRILVLVTTNEPLAAPASGGPRRPARCAARVEFLRFPPEEVAAWLERQGRGPASDGAAQPRGALRPRRGTHARGPTAGRQLHRQG